MITNWWKNRSQQPCVIHGCREALTRRMRWDDEHGETDVHVCLNHEADASVFLAQLHQARTLGEGAYG